MPQKIFSAIFNIVYSIGIAFDVYLSEILWQNLIPKLVLCACTEAQQATSNFDFSSLLEWKFHYGINFRQGVSYPSSCPFPQNCWLWVYVNPWEVIPSVVPTTPATVYVYSDPSVTVLSSNILQTVHANHFVPESCDFNLHLKQHRFVK